MEDAQLVPSDFIDLMQNALMGEANAAREANEKLALENVKVQYMKHTSYQTRMLVKFFPEKGWDIADKKVLVLTPPADTPDAQRMQRSGLVALNPANYPKPGVCSKVLSPAWSATVFFKDGSHYGIINNNLSALSTEDVRYFLKENTFFNVSVTVDPYDPEYNKRSRTLRRLATVLEYEQNPKAPIENSDEPIQHKLTLSPLFLTRLPFEKEELPAALLRGSDIEFRFHYDITVESQKSAIRQALLNNKGMAFMKGPPATGKTKTVAKLIGVILDQVDLRNGRVIATAETNEAVAVACKQTIEALKQNFARPCAENLCCLVISDEKRAMMQISGKALDEALLPCTIQEHIRRIIEEDPQRWARIKAGRIEMSKFGRIQSPEVFKAYRRDEPLIFRAIRERVRVIFSTLSTCHFDNRFFKGQDGKPFCTIMIVDEASQANPISLAGAILATDPDRLIFAGDEKQLGIFSQSPEGDVAFATSTFESAVSRDAPETMLDLQFRTAPSIYFGTSRTFYHGRVQSALATRHRPLFYDIAVAAPRISFLDPKGNKYQLSGPAHFFDIRNSVGAISGVTNSAYNEMEVQLVELLVRAFRRAGIPFSEMLALTGYNAQRDRLLTMEKQLPERGLRARNIDSSQGGEAGMVILSIAKTTDIGFMSNDRRINVGTSRARDGSFLVSKEVILAQVLTWRKYLESMAAANQNYKISFNGPVRMFVDDEEITKYTPAVAKRAPNSLDDAWERYLAANPFEAVLRQSGRSYPESVSLLTERFAQLGSPSIPDPPTAPDPTNAPKNTLPPTAW